MEYLYVYYEECLVGELVHHDDSTLSFQYDPSWLSSNSSFALSPVLVLKVERTFNHRETMSFFENLLPEGAVKKRLEKLKGESLDSSYSFLEKYGRDCAGAFVIVPRDEVLTRTDDFSYEELTLKELEQAHENHEDIIVHVINEHHGRFCLAGAQDKVPLIFLNNRLYVPTNGAPTTHILKPPHHGRSVKDSVFNEFFCMRLAKACGLNVPDVTVLGDKIPFYIVDRFDRAVSNGNIKRVHQLDFCQVQNRLSTEKYESDGGPSLKDNYKTIQCLSSNTIGDTHKYLEWICFNLLIGNNDIHSKNISFISNRGELVLAPFYDLLCTAIYKEYSPNFAFSIANNWSCGQWNRKHFQQEIISWGLDKNSGLLIKTMKETIDKMDTTLPKEVENFNNKYPNQSIVNRINTEITKRIRSFRKRLEI